MSGTWQHRLVRDKEGKLHFAFVRFRPEERHVSGCIDIFNEGADVEEMRGLARELLAACDQGIIGPDGKDPDYDDDENENENEIAFEEEE
jgi:hypothetical protein